MPVRRGSQRARRLLLPVGPGRDLVVEPEDVYYCEADGGDTLVRMRSKRRVRSHATLGEMEGLLAAGPFFRCHRSFLVNLDRVREVRGHGGGDFELKLDPPVNVLIPLARSRRTAFRARFGST